MMGLPRSGKSTVALALSEATGAPIVSRDAIRRAIHGERFLQPAELLVQAAAKYMVQALFNAGHQMVIVDDTNLKVLTRDFWHGNAWETQFLPVETSMDECLARARQTNDEEILPVIVKMADYSIPLDLRTELLYKVDDPYVAGVLANSVSEGLLAM